MCETFHDRRWRHHRDHGRSQAAETPSPFFRKPHRTSTQCTQATVGLRHVRRTHKHVIRHRLTGHETIHNAKPKVKRARRTRAHDERRHVPRNSHGPTQARRTNISRVRHTTNTRAIVFTNTTTQQLFFHTNPFIYTRRPRVRNNAKTCNPRRLRLHANATHEHSASTK